jgi:protein N-lysine methyltransferase METTL21A
MSTSGRFRCAEMPVSRSPSPENNVFAISDAIVPEREQKQAGTSSIDFGGLLAQPLLLHEDLKEGCGGQLWPAGMVLSRYMLSHHQTLKGKHVLEIGAGGGLVGLAVALGCQVDSSIVITDQVPMLKLMEQNIRLNGLSTLVDARVYNWGTDQQPMFPTKTGKPDIVLAADCVYFEPAFPLLLQTLKDLVGPDTTCYFCFKKRRKADLRFIKDMKKTFHVEETEYEGAQIDRRDSLFLYTVTLKSR